jgi:CBS domain-containing protein
MKSGVRVPLMKVHEIMSTDARCVGPANTLVEAAGVMRLFDIGAVPICDDDRVIGMLTDRDIVLRGVANGGDLNHLTVLEAVSESVVPISEDDEVESAVRIMSETRMGRLPVVDREQHLVGMVSRADLVMSEQE